MSNEAIKKRIETTAAYREILQSMTMREIAAEMDWDFPFKSGYRKCQCVRDAAVILTYRELGAHVAPESAYAAEARANR